MKDKITSKKINQKQIEIIDEHLELESLDDLYEEEIEPYETVYENGKWKSSKYRISFKD